MKCESSISMKRKGARSRRVLDVCTRILGQSVLVELARLSFRRIFECCSTGLLQIGLGAPTQ
jgi:hypothetical protein